MEYLKGLCVGSFYFPIIYYLLMHMGSTFMFIQTRHSFRPVASNWMSVVKQHDFLEIWGHKLTTENNNTRPKKKKTLGTLEIVSQFKLQSLTVILDSDLIFNSHIDSVT